MHSNQTFIFSYVPRLAAEKLRLQLCKQKKNCKIRNECERKITQLTLE